MEENAAVADLLAHLLRGLKGEKGGGQLSGEIFSIIHRRV